MFGLNVLAQTTDKADAVRWLDALRPRALLVMDDSLWAEQLAQQFPQASVVHRAYRPDDAELDLKLSPRAFVDTLSPIRTVYHQVFNEPDGYNPARIPGLVAWTIAVMQEASRRGLRLCVLNMGMGQPDSDFVANGAFDGLLRALHEARGQHVLGLHEYFVDNPANEPWHIGRLRHWNERAAKLGIPPPRIVLTECGRDKTGGHDGWRAIGLSERDYAGKLSQCATIWNRYGNVDGAAIFAHGRGFDDRWQTFNVAGAGDLLRGLAVVNETGATQPMDWGTRDTTRTVTQTSTSANVRKETNTTSAAIANLKAGDRIAAVWSKTNRVGTYDWQQIELLDGRLGFVATVAATFVAPAQEPNTPGPIQTWEISLAAAIALKREAGALRDKAIEVQAIADRVMNELKGVN